MDDRYVFDRFHEALELEPNAGAYERFRSTFINLPGATKKRPVFRLRFSRMTLRFAAAVAVVAIAIALVAGYLAIHHPTAGVPATVDQNTKAYQALMRADDTAVAESLSSHCGSVSDTGCVAALGRIATPVQKWVADLQAFRTPNQFVVIDAQLRQHAAALLAELNIATAAVGARDNQGLANAINAGASQASWMGRAVTAITTWQQVTASDYVATVQSDAQGLSLCAGCQALTAPDQASCAGAQLAVCLGDVMPADDQIGQIETDVLEHAAPTSLASKDLHLQQDLAAADTSLTKMLNALLTGDNATFSSALAAYRSELPAVTVDIKAITG